MNEAAPYIRKSWTSKEAAEAIAKDLNALQSLVLRAIRDYGPVSDEQIQDITGMNPSTERPRRIELQRKGLIKEGGVKRTRSGRKAVAWVTA